jgi:hypothetical protein
VEPPSGGPDVTSTGMNTFGGFAAFEPSPALPPAHRKRPRVFAVTGFGVLTVAGAAGAYLGVVNGLGSLLDETPAAADTLPARPAVTSTFTPNAGLGQGPAVVVARPGSSRTPAEPATGTPAVTTAADPESTTPAKNASPIRTTKPAGTGCCANPPVPTPAPVSASPKPSGSGSASAAPSVSVSVSETSATPAGSAEPSQSPQYRHRRQHS